MVATTPAAFDPIPRRLGTTGNFIAAVAILEGAVVAFATNGTDWTVGPASSNGAYAGAPIGVALYSQPVVGGKVAVAMYGSVLKVCEAAGSDILAGILVKAGLTGANGCVVPATTANAGGSDGFVLGVMITKAAANGSGYVLINGPHMVMKGAA